MMNRIVKSVKKVEQNLSDERKRCIICGADARYCVRKHKNSTYCRKCALEHFKFLNYLDKLY